MDEEENEKYGVSGRKRDPGNDVDCFGDSYRMSRLLFAYLHKTALLRVIIASFHVHQNQVNMCMTSVQFFFAVLHFNPFHPELFIMIEKIIFACNSLGYAHL